MTTAKRNFCKALTATFVCLALLLSLFAGLVAVRASADVTEEVTSFMTGNIVSANSNTARFQVPGSANYKPKAENKSGIHVTGTMTGPIEGTTDGEVRWNIDRPTTVDDFLDNILYNGHTVKEWWAGVDASEGAKDYRMIVINVSNSEDSSFDIARHSLTTLNPNNGKPAVYFDDGDTIVLKKGLTLVSSDGSNTLNKDAWEYYTKNDKKIVLGRTLAFRYTDSATEPGAGKGSWSEDYTGMEQYATAAGVTSVSKILPHMADVVISGGYTPRAHGGADANFHHNRKIVKFKSFYDNLLFNGHTAGEWEDGVTVDGETLYFDYGVHVSNDAGYGVQGDQYLRLNKVQYTDSTKTGVKEVPYTEGDTITFKAGCTLPEKRNGAWEYYATDDGKPLMFKETVAYQFRGGKWVRIDWEAIQNANEALIELKIPETNKMHNLYLGVSNNTTDAPVFTPKADNMTGTGAQAAAAELIDFFDFLLINGHTIPEWAKGVDGTVINYNVHVNNKTGTEGEASAVWNNDGYITIVKNDASNTVAAFENGDIVTIKKGFSFIGKKAGEQGEWTYYTNKDGKRAIVKADIGLRYNATNNTWKKFVGGVTAISFADASYTVDLNATRKIEPNVTVADPEDEYTLTWSSSVPAVATVSADGTVKGLKRGKTTITATSDNGGKKASYTLVVKDPNSTPASAMVTDGTLFLFEEDGIIVDPIDEVLESTGYTLEVGDGTEYNYKLVVNSLLYKGKRDLVLPINYGTQDDARVDFSTAEEDSGYMLSAGDVEASMSAANVIKWKTAEKMILEVCALEGSATVTLTAWLPAADNGVFGDVSAKDNTYKLGTITILIELEAEDLSERGRFREARANEVGQVLVDYDWFNGITWAPYTVVGAQATPNGSLAAGWNNFQHLPAADKERLPDFFGKILVNGTTHDVYSQTEGVDLNLHLREQYIEVRQYGAIGQTDAQKMRQWKDGTVLEFKKGFRLIQKVRLGGTNDAPVCEVNYLHDEIGQYWVLDYDQKFVYDAETNSWSKDYSAIDKVTINQATATVKPNTTLQLVAAVVPAADKPDNTMVNRTLTWSSSNTAVATVDENGLVTIGAQEGTVVITAKAADGSAAICTITVSATAKDDDTGEGDGGDKKGCGCGGNVVASAALMGGVMLLAAGLLIAKRRKSKV